MSSFQKLITLVDELYQESNWAEKSSIEVSKATVGWHIAHSYLVIIKSCENLLSNTNRPSKNRKWLRQEVFFLLRKIPRNKIEAPEFVVPIDDNEKEIKRLYDQAMSLLLQIKQHSGGYLSHPFLGPIKSGRVPLFLRIHTAHHLQIIREIIK
ncbi:MAG: DUF1569 domain-containing protein [Flavobacteriaceae bacterium]